MSSSDRAEIRVLAISGSLRRASSNTALLRAAALLAPPGTTIELFEGLDELPHFNPDREHEACPALDRLRRAVAACDGLLFSTPEYAHGVPGSLKNALDWLVGGHEFTGKPVAVLNPSPHSTFAVASLVETVRTMSGRLVEAGSTTVALRSSKLSPEAIAAHADVAPAIRGALGAFARAIEAYRCDPNYLPPTREP
ncbi:MAG: NAD(P)H-dependent oxidoreductase [Deltaproteobacteria bacterium]|nr:NAD(P)H-dependent oxidoreductase [Deltaproteobacteria bacterium]